MQLLNADGESAENEVASVGHDGSATRRDAIFGEKEKKVREELVDVMSALKLGEFASESGAEVAGVEEFGFLGRMAETEAGARIDDAEAATLAGIGAMLTTGRVVDDAGVRERFCHDSPRLERETEMPSPMIL